MLAKTAMATLANTAGTSPDHASAKAYGALVLPDNATLA